MLLNYYQPKHHIKSCRHLADRLGVLVFTSSLVVLLLGFITALNPQWLYGDIAHAVEDTSTANNAKNANSAARNNTTGNTTVGNTTASLTLNTSDIHKDAAPGTVAYAGKNITVRAVNITNYSLTITAPVGLSGNTEFTNIADGSNTTPTTPADMPSNSWGYSYVKEGLTTSNNVNGSDEVDDLSILEALNYTFFTGKPQTLESGNAPTTNTRTLVFAAKFGSNAVNGNYKAEVTISLATTPSKLVFDNITTMQEMTSDICERAEVGDTATLRDARDYPVINGEKISDTYIIRKHEDGRCWMTENLRITGNGSSSQVTPSNSNVSQNWTLPVSSISGFNNNTASNAYYNAATGGTGYYTWCAATAGTCSSVTADGTNAPSSICPKGWRLPTGGTGTGTDFHNLFKNMGLTISNSLSTTLNGSNNWGTGDLAKVQGLPYNFAYTGRVYNDSLENTGTSGYWWSSTAYNSSNAYDLYIYNSSVDPGTSSSRRYGGFAVRCVATDPDLTEIKTMQEMTPRVCEKSAIGATNTLTDTRDGNTYSIRKMEDSRCWMTQNLKLAGGRILTSSDSNVSSDWSMPEALSNTDGYFSDDTASDIYISGSTGYYSWCAATAETCVGLLNDGEHATDSVCPKGWRLPGGQGDKIYGNEFQTFTTAENITDSKAGSSKIRNAPYNFAYTGQINDGVFYDPLSGSQAGRWWSSTSSNSTSAYDLYLGSSDVVPGNRDGLRHFGYAVRCIARN